MWKPTFLIPYLLLLIHSIVNTVEIKFEDVLHRAILNSYDMSAAAIGTKIKEAKTEETKYGQLPELVLTYRNERARDLTDGNTAVTAIGTTTLPAFTKYQNALSAIATYTLIDFGVLTQKIAMAEKDAEAGKVFERKTLVDLKTTILDLYGQTLMTFTEIEAKKAIAEAYQELRIIRERLQGAGLIKATDVLDAQRDTIKQQMEIASLKVKLKNHLADMSFYTGIPYEDAFIAPFAMAEDDERCPFLDYEDSPVSRLAHLEIEKKEIEESLVKRTFFPKLSVYAQYDLYGSDRDDLGAATRDIRERNLSFGGFVSLPFLESVKNYETLKRVKLETYFLKVEKNKKLAELKNIYSKMESTFIFHRDNLKMKRELLQLMESKMAMHHGLEESGAIDRTAFLTVKIEFIHEKLELGKSIISSQVALKRMKFMTEGAQ